MAANPSSVVINSDGRIYGCEHCNSVSLLGNLSGSVAKRKQTAGLSDVRDKCKKCPFLPI